MVRQSTFVKVQSDRSLMEQVTENETTEDLEVTHSDWLIKFPVYWRRAPPSSHQFETNLIFRLQ